MDDGYIKNFKRLSLNDFHSSLKSVDRKTATTLRAGFKYDVKEVKDIKNCFWLSSYVHTLKVYSI